MELAPALEATPTGERQRLVSGALLGSRCRTCGAISWPSRAVCHRCGSPEAEELRLGHVGELITHTRVWVSRPGLEAPFTLGQVELPEGVLVFAHIRGLGEEDRVPLPVQLVPADDPADVPPFWFEPVRA